MEKEVSSKKLLLKYPSFYSSISSRLSIMYHFISLFLVLHGLLDIIKLCQFSDGWQGYKNVSLTPKRSFI